MNTPAPKTSPDAALGNLMPAALDVPTAPEHPEVPAGAPDSTLARTGNTTIPAGWKLVPIEPTTAMVIEGVNAGFDHNDEPHFIYAAMLNAAPAPPAASAAPSDDELSALYLFADGHPFHEWLRRARALLSRYGAQPAADHAALLRRWITFGRGVDANLARHLIADTEAALAQPAASAEPVSQYFHRVAGCPTHRASDAECIFWHDKGTGPYPDARVGDIYNGVTLTWRTKPATPVAAQAPIPEGPQPYPSMPAPDVQSSGEAEDSYSRAAVERAMRAAHDRGYSVGWDHGRARGVSAQAPAAAGDARKELTAAQIEACAQEMAKYAESCRRAAKDVPILVDLYTAQALSGDMAARYLRTVIEKHGRTAEVQQSGQGAGR